MWHKELWVLVRAQRYIRADSFEGGRVQTWGHWDLPSMCMNGHKALSLDWCLIEWRRQNPSYSWRVSDLVSWPTRTLISLQGHRISWLNLKKVGCGPHIPWELSSVLGSLHAGFCQWYISSGSTAVMWHKPLYSISFLSFFLRISRS